MLPKKTTKIDLRQLEDQIGVDPDVYMHRRQFFAVRIPFTYKIVQLRMNKIMREDRDPNPHTHPFPFISFIWKGGYVEFLYDKYGERLPGMHRSQWTFAYRAKDAVHNIVSLDGNKPVTTLFLSWLDIRDPRYGKWGFIQDGEYMESEVYLAQESQRNRRTKAATE